MTLLPCNCKNIQARYQRDKDMDMAASLLQEFMPMCKINKTANVSSEKSKFCWDYMRDCIYCCHVCFIYFLGIA